MAGEGGGARTLWRGVLAAALGLALVLLAVRTMVGRMTQAHVDEIHRRAADLAAARDAERGGSPSEETPSAETPSESGLVPPSSAPAAPSEPPSVPGPSAAPPSSVGASATTEGTEPSEPETVPRHTGTLDAVAIRGVIRDALPEIRFCFEWQLNAHPDLAGRVTMDFTIQPDGTVTNAGVLEDALHDDVVTRCFTHVMSNLRFPPPEGGPVAVHYPFALANSPEARRPEGI